MKKIKLFGVLLVSTMLTFTYPAIAQDNNDRDRTETRADDDDDDEGESGKAGWIGLLGLLGLLGLRKRDNDRDRDRVIRP